MEPIYYLFIPLLILVGLVQSALLPYVRVAGQVPDLMLTIVVSWSLLRGIRQGLIVALMGGIVLDILSGAPFGVFTVSLVGASLLSSLGAAGFFRSHTLLPIIAAVLATTTYYSISLFLLYMGGHRVVWLDSLTRVMLPGLIVNLALMLILFPAMRWLHRKTAQQEMEW